MDSRELIVERLNNRDIMITDLDIHMYRESNLYSHSGEQPGGGGVGGDDESGWRCAHPGRLRRI